jgi:hypothetical protein
MDENLREQIFNSMNIRETDDLIEIWKAHNISEWSELAFDVVKEILIERLGELPPQNKIEANKPPEKTSTCPNCQSQNVFMRAVELRSRMQGVVLKKPKFTLARFLGLDVYDEIVGFACEDCGYVYFMLKDFV